MIEGQNHPFPYFSKEIEGYKRGQNDPSPSDRKNDDKKILLYFLNV